MSALSLLDVLTSMLKTSNKPSEKESIQSLIDAVRIFSSEKQAELMGLLTDTKLHTTLFIPDSKLLEGAAKNTQISMDDLYDAIKYHIVPGRFNFESLQETGYVYALNKKPLMFSTYMKYTDKIGIMINGKVSIKSGVSSTNNAVYFLDTILIPNRIHPSNKIVKTTPY